MRLNNYETVKLLNNRMTKLLATWIRLGPCNDSIVLYSLASLSR